MAEQATRATAMAGAAHAPSSRKLSRHKGWHLALGLLVTSVVALLLAGRAGLELPLLDKLQGAMGGEARQLEAPGASFYDLPEMLVNLNGTETTYLKLAVALELEPGAQRQQLEAYLPRLMDSFQIYLRDLRVEDLQGSAGLQRLREALLQRANAALPTAGVRDVLFKQLLVQ